MTNPSMDKPIHFRPTDSKAARQTLTAVIAFGMAAGVVGYVALFGNKHSAAPDNQPSQIILTP